MSLESEFNNSLSEEHNIATLLGVVGSRYPTMIPGKKKLFESKEEESTFKALLDTLSSLVQ